MKPRTHTHTHSLTTSLFLTPLVLLDKGIGFCAWACFLWMGFLVSHRANVFLPQLGRPALAWPELAWVVPLIPVGTCYSRAQRTWADTCNKKPHKHQSLNASTFWTQVSVGVPKTCSFLNVTEQIHFELKVVLLSAEECCSKGLYSFLSCQYVNQRDHKLKSVP